MEKLRTFKKTIRRIYNLDEENNESLQIISNLNHIYGTSEGFAKACYDYILDTICISEYRAVEYFKEDCTNYYMFATVMTMDNDKNVWRYDFTYNRESEIIYLSSTKLM